MKKISLLVAIFLFLAPSTYADLFQEQAQNAVNMFNSMNNGKGYIFTHKTEVSAGYTGLMTTKAGTDPVDLSAYIPLPMRPETNSSGHSASNRKS